MNDLRAHAVDMVTIGQYLQPTPHHHPVLRYWTPDEFKALEDYGMRSDSARRLRPRFVRRLCRPPRPWKPASPSEYPERDFAGLALIARSLPRPRTPTRATTWWETCPGSMESICRAPHNWATCGASTNPSGDLLAASYRRSAARHSMRCSTSPPGPAYVERRTLVVHFGEGYHINEGPAACLIDLPLAGVPVMVRSADQATSSK